MLAWAPEEKDIVNAVVRVSGKVVVCEDGLRAEELEVVGLVVDARRPRMQKQLKKAWGEVPVFTNWKNALEMFPVYPLSKGSSKRFSAWASAVGFLVVMTLMGWTATQGLDSAWHGFGLLGAAIALSWGAAIATKPLTRSRKSAVVLGFVWFLGSLSVLMIVFISVELALGVGLALIACVALSLWISLLWLDRFSWLYLSRGKPWLGFLFENLLASGVELLLVDGIELVIRRPLKVTQRALKVKQQSEKLLPARVRGVE